MSKKLKDLNDDEAITAYVRALSDMAAQAREFADREPYPALSPQAQEAIRSMTQRCLNEIDRASHPQWAMPISDLKFGIRVRKACHRLGIETVAQLARRSSAELLATKNFGVTSLWEVRKRLKRFRLSLAGDVGGKQKGDP